MNRGVQVMLEHFENRLESSGCTGSNLPLATQIRHRFIFTLDCSFYWRGVCLFIIGCLLLEVAVISSFRYSFHLHLLWHGQSLAVNQRKCRNTRNCYAA